MRYQFLKTEWAEGQEVAYVMDTETGDVLKAAVKSKPDVATPAMGRTVNAPTPGGAGGAGAAPRVFRVPVRQHDPTGEPETAEERAVRLRGKVPPAFLGDIRKVSMDPAKTDGKADVTPFT